MCTTEKCLQELGMVITDSVSAIQGPRIFKVILEDSKTWNFFYKKLFGTKK
jgi:hypothetical protein